jgi:tetratricopeptide (TPR) repeat protein
LSALLLVRILRKLDVRGAWLAAAIFALHPVMVESVAWISELKNTLSGVLFLSASLTYLTYAETGKRRSYLSALGLFILGLLSKTTIAPFPLAMLAVTRWKHGKLSWRQDIAPLFPFFLAGILLGLLTLYVERSHIGTREPELEFSFIERCLIAGRAIWFYLGKVLLPVNLMISYPRWDLTATAWWQYLFPAAALVAGFILWTMRKAWRAPLAVFIYFTAMLLPFLGFFSFFTFRYSFAADHYQYLAAIGPIVMAAGLLEIALDSARRGRGLLKAAISVTLLLTLGVLTWKQSGMYSDAETLYRTTIARNDRSWMAHNNLGIVLANMGRADEAVVQYQKALEVKPNHADAYYNLGHLFAKMGRTDEALAHYQKALDIDPNHAKAHINLGGLLADLGRADEALAHYAKASEIDPNDSGIQYNLGSLLEDMGRTDEAIAHYQKALILTPDHPETHYNLGHLLARMGRSDEAIAHYQQTLKLSPDRADTHNNLGILLASRGQGDEAIAHFRKASELDPQSIGFLKNLATALSQQGQLTEASFILTKAFALSRSTGDEVQAKAVAEMRAKLNRTIDSSSVDSKDRAQY